MSKETNSPQLNELKDLFAKYKVICITDMEKMPTKQMQLIKKSLGGSSLFRVSKKSLVELAMKETGKDLIGHLPKQPGLVFTSLDPFSFFKQVNGMSFKTYAKEGYVSRGDVIVQPGPTELLPGPAISELQKVGIIAGVEGGKIAVKKTSTILKKDQIVTPEIAGVLRKLKLQVGELKLNITTIFDGMIYSRETLELVETYPQKMKEAFQKALNLSVSITYPTKENVKYLIIKAYQRGKAIEKKVGG